jgi:hypothetical protein
MEPSNGSVVVFNSREGGWFSSAQRFLTAQPFTHTAVIGDNVFGVGKNYIGAYLAVTIQPWQNALDEPGYDFIVYKPLVSQERIQRALNLTYKKFASKDYGFLQTIWFVYRWFMWYAFRKDVRKQHNFFPSWVICSEFSWWYIWFLFDDNVDMMQFLDEWRPDTCSSGDIAYICNSRKEFVVDAVSRWNTDTTQIKFKPIGVK